MARHPSDPRPNSPPGTILWLTAIVLVVSGFIVAIVVGFGPMMALAPSPVENGGQWAQVESIDVGPENGTATTVTVTYRTGGSNTSISASGTHRFTVAGVDPGLVNAPGDWAYLPKSSLPPPLAAVDGNHSAGVVTVGPWALIGNLSGTTKAGRTAPITVVAPAGMDVDPSRKVHFLSTFVSPYELQQVRGEPATILVAPAALPYDGVTYGTRAYITQHAFWDGHSASVWIHEYLHTQQTFETGPEMEWFREASATYLAARMLEEQYYEVEPEDVRAWILARDRSSGVSLADGSAWGHSNANYYRGARLLYAVDAAIRDGSGGEHTLVDVFREMNAHKGPVTIDEFVHLVEFYSGAAQPWLRPAITESGALDGRVPDSEGVFGD
ncbi:MAG: hypothetical protein U5K70_04955 [Halodesulfurarchaeum sp.]|nr:hypothetical protein [Halodesulfurarchaeum sp.]